MVRPIPKKNFVWVEDASSFNFSNNHRAALLGIMNTKTRDKKKADDFLMFIEREIRMLRPQRKLEIESPSQQEVKEAISHLKKKSQKLQEKSIDFQQELCDLDAESRRLLRKVWQDYDDGTQKFHVSDFISDLEGRISHLLLVINETERITLKKGRPTNNSLRQFSKRLAFEYQNIFVMRPKKSQEGAFGQILKICLEAAGYCTVNLFPLIKEAVDYSEKKNSHLK